MEKEKCGGDPGDQVGVRTTLRVSILVHRAATTKPHRLADTNN